MNLISVLLIAVGLAMDAFAVSVSTGMTCCDFRLKHNMRMSSMFGLFQFAMPVIGFYAATRFQSYIENFDHWIAFILLLFIGGKMLWEAFAAKNADELLEGAPACPVVPGGMPADESGSAAGSVPGAASVTGSPAASATGSPALFVTGSPANDAVTSAAATGAISADAVPDVTASVSEQPTDVRRGFSAAESLTFKHLLVLAVATSIDALAVGVSFAFLKTDIWVPSVIIGIVAFAFSFAGGFLGRKIGPVLGKTAEIMGGLILCGIGIKILLDHLFFS